MKRLTALILTAVMVFGIIPASFMSASAHGTGVGMNNIPNLSINNAANQIIPATVNVDGSEDDTGWDHDDWQTVNAGTGIWDAVHYRSSDFSYKYQLHSDYQYLYGIVKLDTAGIHNGDLNDITIWINSDKTVTHYTAKIVFTFDKFEGEKALFNTAVELCDASGNTTPKTFDDIIAGDTLAIEKSKYVAVNKNGSITLEFRYLTKILCGDANANMTAYVSVGAKYKDGEVQNLYHPRFDAQVDKSDINPVTAWPEGAKAITQREVYALPNADYSNVLPNEMVIDGRLEEGVWAPYTTMYTEGKDRFEYRQEGTFAPVDFSNVKYNLVDSFNDRINTGWDVPIKYKYDVRYDKNNLYGAVVAYCDVNSLASYFVGADESHKGGAISLWLTVRPIYKDTAGTWHNFGKQVIVRSTCYIRPMSNDNTKYTLDTSKNQSTAAYYQAIQKGEGADADAVKLKGGGTRTGDYLVDFEFQLPISTLDKNGLRSDYTYGYVLSVNCNPWLTFGEHTSSVSDMSTLSSGASEAGISSSGNYFAKTDVVNTENWSADGRLEYGRWTAIKAADNKIDYGSRDATSSNHVTYTPKNNAFSTEHLAYDLFADDDYLYGIALIEDPSWNSSKSYNIWINNGVPRWNDWYDNMVSFYYNADGTTSIRLRNHYVNEGTMYGGTENLLTGIYNAYSDKSVAISKLVERGFTALAGKTSISEGSFADKWLMQNSVTSNTQGVEAVFKDVGNNVKLLEFKLPLEMLCISEKEYTGTIDYAFTYTVSITPGGDGTSSNAGELSHPMMSNRKMNELVKDGSLQNERMMYIGYGANGRWSSQESLIVRTAADFTNNVADGKLQEEYWDTLDEMVKVDGATGEWQDYPDGTNPVDYSYRVYTSREWLYGSAVINAEGKPDNTKFTLYFNNKVTGDNKSGTATGWMEIYLNQNMVPVCNIYDINYEGGAEPKYSYTGFMSQDDSLHGDVKKAVVPFEEDAKLFDMSSTTDAKDIKKNYGYGSMKTINGVTYVEFKLNLDKYVVDNSNKTKFTFASTGSNGIYSQDKNIDEFYVEAREKFEYVVSVEQDSNVLFHRAGDTYQLWVTGVNPASTAITSGGYIINKNISDYVLPDGGTYILFRPTRIKNVYQVAAMNWLTTKGTSEDVDNAWAEWENLLANPVEGEFLYKLYRGGLETFPEVLRWKANTVGGTGMLDTIMSGGNYVRFDKFNPMATNLDDMVDRMGNDSVGFDMRGYATYATFEPYEHPGNDLNLKQNHETEYPHIAWTFTTDYNVMPLKNFAPEKVTIDGYLNDTGWDDDKWIHVSNDVNGNVQNPGKNTSTDFEYEYQMRTDGEYVYIGVLMNRDPDYDTTSDNWKSSPQFRIWIQSQGEGYDYGTQGYHSFEDAISFTHFFDVRLGEEGTLNDKGQYLDANNGKGNIQSTITVDKYNYSYDNPSFNPLNSGCDVHVGADDSVTVNKNGDKLNVTYEGVTMRYGTHVSYNKINGKYNHWWHAPNGGLGQTWGEPTTMDITNGFGGNSVFYGETKTHYENAVTGKGQEMENNSGQTAATNWFAQPSVTKYTYGEEHAAYNTTSDGKKTVVELKFALSDIGTDAEHGFKYYVQCSSVSSETSNGFVLFHPHFTKEPDNGNNAYDGYYLPFWIWGENAIYCDEQWFYDNALNNPKTPVLPLGSKYFENYYSKEKGKFWDSALRFGVLYNHEYVNDVYGNTAWEGEDIYKNATYWDIKEIAMIYLPTNMLSYNADGTDISLYTDTKSIKYQVSDAIIQRITNSNMADYDSYVFYATQNVSGNENRKFTFRGVVEYYPYDDIYYDRTDIPTHKDNVAGFNERPSYYSPILTRSFNMVKAGSQTFDNSENFSEDIYQPNKEYEKIDLNGKAVAYIPLDNRPVNYQRVQYLAQSVGINLLMPPEEYFTNTLDNDGNGPDGDSDSGNPLQLLNWLKSVESEASYYVLSLDMLFSGGLIGSRAPEIDTDYDDDNKGTEFVYTRDDLTTISEYEIGSLDSDGMYSLSEGEEEILNYLADLAARDDKYVVYFDTIVRLASTTYYGNYTIDDYNTLRNGFGDKPRVQLYGSDLTLKNIFAGYLYDEDNNALSDGVSCTANGKTTNKVAQYIFARKRKLTIIDKLLQTPRDGVPTADNIDKLILGADDSKPIPTIQTNELRYLEEKLLGNNDNVVVMAAADELGQLGISDITSELYGRVNVNVHFFGNGKNEAADDFDRGTLASTVKAHVNAAGAYYDNNVDGGMDILILTKQASTSEQITNVKKLLEKAKSNIANNVPTCIVDASGAKGPLASYMFGLDFKSKGYTDMANYALKDIGMLMGYSQWNTVANSLGVSMGNAIARYAYLKNCSNVTAQSNYGFMKNMTYAFVKDIAYVGFGNPVNANGVTISTNNPSTTYCDTNAATAFYKWGNEITKKINASRIYVGELGTEGSISQPFTKVNVSDLYFPWDRHFEADFNITFASATSGNVAPNGSYVLPLADADKNTPFVDGILTDSKAQNTKFPYGNNEEWCRLVGYTAYGSDATMDVKNVTFTFDEAINAGYVRIHLMTPNQAISGIQSPYAIVVSGSNDMTNWHELGTINPNTVTSNPYEYDYVLPNGNGYPGIYYRFWPEAQFIQNETAAGVTTDIYGSWMTIPLQNYVTVDGNGNVTENSYKYFRIYLKGWGNTYFNEIEIYEADANYNSEWILSGEEVYGN